MIDHTPQHLCPSCGYNLAPPDGVDDLTCPECGCQTSRQEASSHVERRIIQRFYTKSAVWIIGPTLIPNAILIAGVVFSQDFLNAFLYAWMFCVPLSLLGSTTVAAMAFRRSPWEYRRRMRARWIVLMVFIAIFSAGGWYAIYRVSEWFL